MTTDLSAFARIRPGLQTRSISAENPDGRPGGGGRATEGFGAVAARDLGQGWKVSPAVNIESGQTYTFVDVDGPGIIQHIWIATLNDRRRSLVLRAYWDSDSEPAIEVPLGDFFCQATPTFAQIGSIPIAANTEGALNSYWPMPFRRHARLTVENLGEEPTLFFYQVTYQLGGDEIDQLGYLHTQWRRSNPLAALETHVLVEAIEGRGHYAGTFISWQANNNGWWGEGEVKFYLDDDTDFPTICGTGTEDYFGGAWCFEHDGRYVTYSGPYSGFPQALLGSPNEFHRIQPRFALYRWHLPDPIRFDHRLAKVDIQALGWRSGGRYLPLQDDISSTAFFYLDRTSANRPALPDHDGLEII
jgi:hypothetical protein